MKKQSSFRQYFLGLTDEQLQKETRSIKPTKLYDSLIVGLLIGISIYSIIKKGFGLLTFLPLLYLPIATKNRKRREELEKVMEERNLKFDV